MKTHSLNVCHLLALILGTMSTTPATAQPIAPAKDGTGTTVNQNGNHINIQGGTRSRDGTNLFHSFDKFNVSSGQTANFISTPDTRNILGRVTGGNASYINGLIQVIGGNSNLFLMNPAGIMFGSNASLNIPASFSVTTATGIGFNNNNYWFDAIGTNDYANLVGNPSGYRFNVSNPGAIVNQGNLNLTPGQNLTLLGGTVINTGQLSTAGGNITIATVEGGSTLKISQPGHLLSLEVSSTVGSGENISNLTPLSLPALLTGGETTHASTVIVNPNGEVVLTNSNTLVAETPGVAIASGNIDVSTTENIGGQINVLGDRVALIDTNINANGINGGGTVLIGGDFQGNGIVPNSQQTFVNNNSFISADAITNGNGGQVIVWSDGITNFAGNISAKGGEYSGNGGFVEVSGKQQLIFDGNVNVSAAFGTPGTILLDPENVTVGESETTAKKPEIANTEIADTETETPEKTETKIADKSETTKTPIDPFAQDEKANVTISASNIGELSGDVILQADNDITVNEKIETTESVELKAGRSININADIDTSSGNSNITLFGNDDGANINNRESGAAAINQKQGTTLNSGSGEITIRLGNLGANGDINLANLTTTGQILLNANRGNIRRVSPNSLITANQAIFETEDTGGIGLAEAPLRIDVNNLEVLTGGKGVFIESISNLTIGGVSEDLQGISTRRGGDIELNINGNITVTEEIFTSAPDRQPGKITINSSGNIDTTQVTLNANSESTTGGDIFISADGDIKTGKIDASTRGKGGGNITINSGGEIDTTAGDILSNSVQGDGGNVRITSQDDLKIGAIDSHSETNGRGGNITLESTGANVDINGDKLASFSRGGNDAGDITITSNGYIKTGDIFSSSGQPLDEKGNLENSSSVETNNNTGSNQNQNGSGSGGDITLKAGGTIDTSVGTLESFSREGDGGNVSITSKGDITTGRVLSTAGNPENDTNTAETTQTEINGGNSGDINIESTEGVVTTQREINSFASEGDGGNVTIKSHGDISIDDNINSRSDANGNGGNIIIESATGGINIRDRLSSKAQDGNGGFVRLSSPGNIQTAEIESLTFSSDGGNVIIESTDGTVDTTGGSISSRSHLGNGGDVAIASNGNLTTGDIDSRSESNGRGGNITLESLAGNVDTSSGVLASFSRVGNAGDVTITSNGDLITGEISSFSGDLEPPNNELLPSEDLPQQQGKNSGGSGGSITLKAEGEINTTAGVLESFSRQGAGGDISLEAKGNIITNAIISSAGDPENIPPPGKQAENATTTKSQVEGETGSSGGDINIESIEGTVTTQGELISYANKGNGGNVTIIGNGDINTADIDSRADTRGRGGNIFIESKTGAIDTLNGELASSSRTGDGGNVEIVGAGNIQVETIFSFSEGNGNGGDVSITGNSDIKTATIESSAEGGGKGGDIYIIADGAIDTSVGDLLSQSEQGKGGNVILSATGDITTGFIESFSASGVQGGNITLESSNGNIDTTVGFLGGEAKIPTDADVSSEDVAITFASERANLSSYAPEGTGGNILIIQRGQGNITTSNISSFGGESSGAVNIINNDGNINTGAIFSTALNGAGGQISIETVNNGDLNINHIATYSAANNGTGGDISLNASGIVNINNMASFGNSGSGDVSIQSSSGSINTGTIQTRAPNGTSGNITLNTFSTLGDIRTAKVSTEGTEAAGKVEIIAPDGSVTTEDLKSSSESGNAGGIDVQAGDDIQTGDQTVDSATGDSNINNQAAGNINTGNQTATTQQGNASINNQAAGNINTGNQTATTQQGNTSINNQAAGNINTGNQTATTQQGNASINNQAGSNINTGNQTATTQQGNASINNQTAGNINTENQTATTQQGNASINNQAGSNINTGNQTAIGETTNIINQPGGENNTGEIIQISPPPSALINNTLLQQLPQIPANPPIPAIANLVQPPINPPIPAIANLVQSPINPPIPPLNRVITKIIESVQSNSSIITSNNPNLQNHQKSDRQQGNINTDTTTTLRNINIINSTPLTVAANSQTLATIEQNRNNEFADYFKEDLSTLTSTKNIQEVLTEIARQTGNNSAIIYVSAYPEALQLILYKPSGDPILKTIPQANRQELIEVVQQFRAQITNPARRNTQSYLPPAQKLYNWLIAPISAELEAANIQTILFSMDEGLRALPVAALHDGQKFLIEKYSLSLIPSISLIDTNYRPLQNTQVLAMGASKFIQQNPLPAVPIELNTISQKLWQGTTFLNQDFTRNNLLTQRQNYPYPIIHLATHAEFKAGAASNSYIQLWGAERLQLDQIRQLGWNQPPVELLVLSACRTAVGDKNAELGFAGLAIAAGVKSALASVWYVSDEGTLGLMIEFYTHLNHVKIKAEALRQAQLAMLRGEVVIAEGELRGTGARGAVVLPSALGKFENQNLSHPYYWAGFTMIGSPW